MYCKIDCVSINNKINTGWNRLQFIKTKSENI